jgi:hypothetical protein
MFNGACNDGWCDAVDIGQSDFSRGLTPESLQRAPGLGLAMLAHQDECFPGLDTATTKLACRDIYPHCITAKLVERMSNSLLDIVHVQMLGLGFEDAAQEQVCDAYESGRHSQGFLPRTGAVRMVGQMASQRTCQ